MKKKIIALVCCRQNSRGIKNKNIKNFYGKPLLYWTFKNIFKSKLFDKIYLSTDGKNISKVGKKLGFDVPHLRPKKLATSSSDVFETHKFFFNKLGLNDENCIVCIINNNPFIDNFTIKKSFKIFKKNKFKFIVMGAIPISTDQIFFRQMKLYKSRLFPKFKNELIKSQINRKDYKIYYNTGDIRWGKPSWLTNFKDFNKRISQNGFKFFEINTMKYNDINNLNDWKDAIRKFKSI